MDDVEECGTNCKGRKYLDLCSISAGIDIALEFVEYMTDEKTAVRIQLGAEYTLPAGHML
jgi:hypothetical protein